MSRITGRVDNIQGVSMTEFLSTSGAGRVGLDRITVLLEQADFVLAEPYLSELIQAYGHVQRMSARLQGYYRFDEEPIHIFNPRAGALEGDGNE